MRVLDDEQRRHHQHALEERLDGLEELLAARRRVERVGLRRRQHLGVERDRQQRQPRREVGHHAGDERRELRAGLLARAVRRDARELAEQVAPGEERRRRRVLLAGGRQLREAERERAQLADEPRLADARLADELDDPELAHARRVDRVLQELELRLAPDDRSRVDLRLVARSDGRADVVRRDGALLALDEQRLLLGRVDRLRAVEHLGGRQDVARLRARR